MTAKWRKCRRGKGEPEGKIKRKRERTIMN
jgi:hypothetical protein